MGEAEAKVCAVHILDTLQSEGWEASDHWEEAVETPAGSVRVGLTLFSEADQPREKSCGPERMKVSPVRMDAGRSRRESPVAVGIERAGGAMRGSVMVLTLRQGRGLSSYSKK